MAAKEGGGGGSTAVTSHSVVGEWTHVSKSKLPATVIKEVADSLAPLKERWKEVGKLFNFTQRELEDINKKNEGSHEKCLREIVDKWLNSAGCNPTWQLLAEKAAMIDVNVSVAIAMKHPAGGDEKPDLNDLMNAIAVKISHQWKEVGTELGLGNGELASFQMIYPKKPLECWREVITKWRNKADDNHKYCLATILSALNSRVVDAKEVAKGYQKALQEVHKLNSEYAEKGKRELSSSDLKDLMNNVGYKVKDSWRSIGSELGLSVAELNGIGETNLEKPIQCISAVLSKWISSQSKTPVTWQTVLVSLCKPQVSQKEVADEVYREFLKGSC